MSKLHFPDKAIFLCDGSKCGKHKEIRRFLKDAIKEAGLKDDVEIVKIECTDRCKHAPIMCVQPANQWYSEVSLRQAQQIFEEHIA
ncbi:MAG: (2Fe-2S) ferredoxin domain-containing protein, partial [Spirosomaceae bacterium]|nr:(2Fe-2S) ferredoxin domain-containing protein [Spirosomataceae bacterium]